MTFRTTRRSLIKGIGTSALALAAPRLALAQAKTLVAAKGNKPPFDVAFFDAPQVIDAVRDGLIVEYPMANSPNFKGTP